MSFLAMYLAGALSVVLYERIRGKRHWRVDRNKLKQQVGRKEALLTQYQQALRAKESDVSLA